MKTMSSYIFSQGAVTVTGVHSHKHFYARLILDLIESGDFLNQETDALWTRDQFTALFCLGIQEPLNLIYVEENNTYTFLKNYTIKMVYDMLHSNELSIRDQRLLSRFGLYVNEIRVASIKDLEVLKEILK